MTSTWVARRLDFVSDFPELEAAFARTHPSDPHGELEVVVGELYEVRVRVRVGVDVLERSIEDLPELARIFAGVRRELFARYERYLRQRRQKAPSGSSIPRPSPTCWWSCAPGRPGAAP